MLRKLVEMVSEFFAWLKRNRMIKPKEDCVKVNIGCGLAVAKGWINVDGGINIFFSKWPHNFHKFIYKFSNSKQWYSQENYCDIIENHVFIHHNLKYGLPFVSESIDFFYSSHLLEHLFRDDAVKLLKQIYCALKKGGMVRICVPDLEKAIQLYLKGEREKFLEYFFSTSKTEYFGHLYMYDLELLKKVLVEAGFLEITKCSYRQGKIPDAEKLDSRPDESSLYVEAIKSEA